MESSRILLLTGRPLWLFLVVLGLALPTSTIGLSMGWQPLEFFSNLLARFSLLLAGTQGLATFAEDYPMARSWLVYSGPRAYREGNVQVIPIGAFLRELPELL